MLTCACIATFAPGTWCSGITSAPHAEGPGFKSQCVHFSHWVLQIHGAFECTSMPRSTTRESNRAPARAGAKEHDPGIEPATSGCAGQLLSIRPAGRTRAANGIGWTRIGMCMRRKPTRRMKGEGLLRELNPGPLAPEARIMPLDQAAGATGCSQAPSLGLPRI